MSDVKLIIPPEGWNLNIGFELNKETNLFDKSTITIQLPNDGIVDLQYRVAQDIISLLNEKYWSKTNET